MSEKYKDLHSHKTVISKLQEVQKQKVNKQVTEINTSQLVIV